MKKQITHIICLLFISFSISVKSQVGIGLNNPDPNTILDIYSTNKGLLIPRVQLLGTDDVTTIPVTSSTNSPEQGTLVYNLLNNGTSPNNVFQDTFYIWSGTQWESIGETSDVNTEINNNNLTKVLFAGSPAVVNAGYTMPGYSSWTTMNFTTERVDIGNIHNGGTFTVPATGLYSFFGDISLRLSSTNGNSKAFGARIFNSTSTTVLAISYYGTGAGGAQGDMPLYWMGNLTAGDQIQVQYRMRADNSSTLSTATVSNITVRKHF
ncbi:hypothetical protein [Chryseobacterium sp. JV274]|uniref:hypothetical protein n=1 Tax=Chryseobacterium sp. JV274 TaxID=1932669 RepID=UPI0015C2695C|nr:hypothetical protein [Chryseobacterium sp. JV274]CAD0224621.1 conserved exported protein of unknown function [Chryseobacterium sp. JV274]